MKNKKSKTSSMRVVPPQWYIEVDMCIYKEDEKRITQKELNGLIDDFIDMVEKRGMYCGGGMQIKKEKSNI